MKQEIGNQNGFSIMEVMVAFVIILVVFIGLVGSFPFGMAINKSAENSTVASYLAQEEMENLISQGYQDVGIGTVEARARLSNISTDYLYNFEREVIVTYVDENLNNSVLETELKKIITTVYYTDTISRRTENYSLISLISLK